MMMMTKTHIIKGGLADSKFDCFSAVSHQLNHVVPGRPSHDDDNDDVADFDDDDAFFP